jgi:hypothetical protein
MVCTTCRSASAFGDRGEPIDGLGRLVAPTVLIDWTSATQATSSLTATPNSPVAVQPSPGRTGSQLATQARATVVGPNQRPKLVGLGHDYAPDPDPPTTTQTAAWASPMTISPAPTRWTRRWQPHPPTPNHVPQAANTCRGGHRSFHVGSPQISRGSTMPPAGLPVAGWSR